MALIFATHPLFTSAITVKLSTFWVALSNYTGQVWWPEPIVALLGRLRPESQVNQEWTASLEDIVRACLSVMISFSGSAQ